MWVLLIIIVDFLPGVNIVTPIHDYTTEAECESELIRINNEMIQAYPDDHDFTFVCQFDPKKAA